MSQIQIRDKFNNPAVLVNYTVSRSDNPDDPYVDDFFTDFAGNSSWPHYGMPNDGLYLHVNHFNKVDEFEYQLIKVEANHTDDILIELAREVLPKIAVRDLDFTINGQAVYLKGNTDFLLYKKYLELPRQNVIEILNQRMNAGSRFIRTFGMVNSFSSWHPQNYGVTYYDKITEFAKLLNEFGLYWYFNVFADTGEIMPSLVEQQDHFNKVVYKLSQCNNVFLELVNEQGQHTNSVERSAFAKPSNIISCSGSFGSPSIPPNPPHWDFIDMHVDRNYPKSVKDCNMADYKDNQNMTRIQLNKPIGSGEPMKFGTDYETTNRIAKEVGSAGLGTSPFNVFHSQNGVMSDLFDGTTHDNAEAFFGGN